MEKEMPMYRLARFLLPPVCKLLYRYRYINRNNLPTEGRCIVACNHLTVMDPLLIAIGQKRQLFYIAKNELFKSPILRFFITGLGAFPVVRGAGDQQAINKGEQLLKDGRVLGIFIEGTRSKTGELLRPRSGVSVFAHATASPVIPTCIVAKGGKLRLFHRTTIIYGNPLTPEELGIKEGTSKEFRDASRMIMDKIAKMRAEYV